MRSRSRAPLQVGADCGCCCSSANGHCVPARRLKGPDIATLRARLDGGTGPPVCRPRSGATQPSKHVRRGGGHINCGKEMGCLCDRKVSLGTVPRARRVSVLGSGQPGVGCADDLEFCCVAVGPAFVGGSVSLSAVVGEPATTCKFLMAPRTSWVARDHCRARQAPFRSTSRGRRMQPRQERSIRSSSRSVAEGRYRRRPAARDGRPDAASVHSAFSTRPRRACRPRVGS